MRKLCVNMQHNVQFFAVMRKLTLNELLDLQQANYLIVPIMIVTYDVLGRL